MLKSIGDIKLVAPLRGWLLFGGVLNRGFTVLPQPVRFCFWFSLSALFDSLH